MSISAIMIDSREPETIAAQSFGVPAMSMMLDCGDVWATTSDGDLLVFERKTPGDLLSSIKDGRLFQQIRAMREQTEWAYLVITGSFFATEDGYVAHGGKDTRWKWSALQGVLSEVQERGVTVWYAPCDAKFAETVQVIAKRDRQGLKPVSPRVDTRQVTPSEAILMALPGIGYERAGQLLEEFDCTPVLALAWLTDTHAWNEVSNIGKATKRNVRKALGMTDDMELCIKTAERDLDTIATVFVRPDDTLAAQLVEAL